MGTAWPFSPVMPTGPPCATCWPVAGTWQADVLLAPHHGSDSSFLPEFLTAVRPRLVVASCGAFNRFGHPGKQLRQWLEEQHIPLLQTGRYGHVRVTWPLSGDRDVPLLDWDTARPVRP